MAHNALPMSFDEFRRKNFTISTVSPSFLLSARLIPQAVRTSVITASSSTGAFSGHVVKTPVNADWEER